MNFNEAEDTFFQVKNSLNCRGRLLDLSTPAIMGILNLTPDSFFDGGKITDEKSLLTIVESMISEGADMLDIGGQSTRPGAKQITKEEEWTRISPALKSIRKEFSEVIISIDTFYSDVAGNSIEEGASIINDISGGQMDENMFATIARCNCPYVLMHIKGTPANMQVNPHYENVVDEVLNYFIQKADQLKKIGVTDIILDPGFGFGKTVDHNYELLKNLNLFRMLNLPILAGLSRKSMITKVLDSKPAEALNGTTVLNTLALLNGASILRVHDVKEAVEVRKIIQKFNKSS